MVKLIVRRVFALNPFDKDKLENNLIYVSHVCLDHELILGYLHYLPVTAFT